MDRLHTLTAQLGLSLLALTLVACGDSGDGGSTQGDSQTEDGPTGDGDGDSGSGDGDGDGDSSCLPGELGCECNGGQCLGDLECVEDVCTEPGGDGDGDSGDGDGDTGDGDGDSGDGDGDGDSGDGDGDGDSGDGDGDGGSCPNPNEMMCDGECIDVLDNDDNCGACGNVCFGQNLVIFGGCEDGACLPYPGECFQQGDYTNCDEACAAEGKTCAPQGCDGATALLYSVLPNCEGVNSGYAPTPQFCDEDFPVEDDYMRCCCAEP